MLTCFFPFSCWLERLSPYRKTNDTASNTNCRRMAITHAHIVDAGDPRPTSPATWPKVLVPWGGSTYNAHCIALLGCPFCLNLGCGKHCFINKSIAEGTPWKKCEGTKWLENVMPQPLDNSQVCRSVEAGGWVDRLMFKRRFHGVSLLHETWMCLLLTLRNDVIRDGVWPAFGHQWHNVFCTICITPP